MMIQARQRFDREDPALGKSVRIPIVVTDSGQAPQSAERDVFVIIGDEVSPRRSGAERRIFS